MLVPILALAMMTQPQWTHVVLYGPDTGELAESCRKGSGTDDNANLAPCANYIMGVVDAQAIQERSPSVRYCLNEGIKTLQLAKVFVKYVDDHPEDLNKAAPFVLAKAFSKAFPCSK